MKEFNQIAAFLKKNKVIIYVILGTILLMQLCSPKVSDTRISDNKAQNTESHIDDVSNDISNNKYTQPQPSHAKNYQSLIFMIILVLGFFVAKRYGYLDKLFPRIIILRLSFAKQKSTGNLIARVLLINHKKESLNFENPILVFHKGRTKREFVIKNIGGVNYFPLTLTSGVGHKFNVDVQKFYKNIDGLDKFKTINVRFKTTSGKQYNSIKLPIWMVTKTLK